MNSDAGEELLQTFVINLKVSSLSPLGIHQASADEVSEAKETSPNSCPA